MDVQRIIVVAASLLYLVSKRYGIQVELNLEHDKHRALSTRSNSKFVRTTLDHPMDVLDQL